jgi:CDP-diacylglycerol--serine O-phosphatidyltransferase
MSGKSRYIVPNAFTSFNFLLGVASIAYSSGALGSGDVASRLLIAAHLIIMSALLDKLDGFAAKKLDASSEFGAQFDSLADLIAFGIAPAFLTLFAYKEMVPDWYAIHQPLVLIGASLYVLFAAMRLAKYNAMDADGHPHYFVGMPSTFAGIVMALTIWLFLDYNLFSVEKLSNLPVVTLLISAVLMVSPLYLSKLRRQNSQIVNVFQLINVVGAYVCGFAQLFPEYLLSLVVIYFIVGFSFGIINRDKISAEEKTSLVKEA